jgi:hypothetical protein
LRTVPATQPFAISRGHSVSLPDDVPTLRTTTLAVEPVPDHHRPGFLRQDIGDGVGIPLAADQDHRSPHTPVRYYWK